jgi:hypothetical protein
MYSSIKSEKNIFNIPKELNKYALFLSDKEKNILWSDWKNKGKTYDYGEICPYCAEKFKQCHEKENDYYIFKYKHIATIFFMFNYTRNYNRR